MMATQLVVAPLMASYWWFATGCAKVGIKYKKPVVTVTLLAHFMMIKGENN
jgi:hypothetical protein